MFATSEELKGTYAFERSEKYSVNYTLTTEGYVYCHDIDGLFRAFGIEHVPSEWRLSIDANKKSLKAFLVHNIIMRQIIICANNIYRIYFIWANNLWKIHDESCFGANCA